MYFVGNFFSFPAVKNCENLLGFDKAVPFFPDTVYSQSRNNICLLFRDTVYKQGMCYNII